jgi:hypothetical protein
MAKWLRKKALRGAYESHPHDFLFKDVNATLSVRLV